MVVSPMMAPRSPSDSRKIVLIGMMGSGKSSTGRRLAESLQSSFVDLDECIERRAGRSIREIFATDGEQTFRNLEQEELRRVLDEPKSMVIAAGGGIVVRDANRRALTDADDVIWLQASLEELTRRVGARAKRQKGHRPLVDGDPAARLKELMDERRDWYRDVATAIVLVDDRTIEEVVAAMTAILEQREASLGPVTEEA